MENKKDPVEKKSDDIQGEIIKEIKAEAERTAKEEGERKLTPQEEFEAGLTEDQIREIDKIRSGRLAEAMELENKFQEKVEEIFIEDFEKEEMQDAHVRELKKLYDIMDAEIEEIRKKGDTA